MQTQGVEISAAQTSLLSYVNLGENIAKRSKMSTDISKTALCSLMKWFDVLHLSNSELPHKYMSACVAKCIRK